MQWPSLVRPRVGVPAGINLRFGKRLAREQTAEQVGTCPAAR
jgi:hypothetical protein